jgi:hypothetical protein
MSDDEDDVVVLRVCYSRGCVSMEDLQFDEEVGELFCAPCRALFARALKEGFSLLLNEDDRAVGLTIFTAFDSGRKGFWSFEDYQRFVDKATSKGRGGGNDPICSDDELRDYFKEEYDINLERHGPGAGEFAVTLQDLLDMYGGYQFNGMDALREDSENLEEGGSINLSALE